MHCKQATVARSVRTVSSTQRAMYVVIEFGLLVIHLVQRRRSNSVRTQHQLTHTGLPAAPILQTLTKYSMQCAFAVVRLKRCHWPRFAPPLN